MTKESFWWLINSNRRCSDHTQNSVLLTLQKRLLDFPAREIVDFYNYLKEYIELADTPNLIAAAVVIHQDISEAGFRDFRSWLVSLGWDIYRNALESADSLAEVDIDLEQYTAPGLFQSFEKVASSAYEVKNLLEQDGLQKFCENKYFSLNSKGIELAEQILKYHSVYEKPFARSEDPIVVNLCRMLEAILWSHNIYEEAAKYPLSEQQKREIKYELSFERSIFCPRHWSYEALDTAVPELYAKYYAHSFMMGEI